MAPETTSFEPTKVVGIDAQLSMGEGSVFKGSPNVGVPAGPEVSPQLGEALAQVGNYQGQTPPGE